ncbi:MAG: tetratricopeptide repeat protein [Alphaproteobacteria bacterium]|nr:tetratricopeptide repeat protein [Alphaproteobacteria bacterium]MCB9792634.1 tetratricopeptide repeat protein [Alphaproteobacteria bacterium]
MNALLLWSLLGASPAMADEAGCERCCEASGLGTCEARLRVVGDESIVVARMAGDFEVVGLWVLPCEGSGFFDVGETARFADAPVTGEVATADTSPAMLRCFRETCALPQGTCPQAVNNAPVLRRCADNTAVTDADLARPSGPAPSSSGATAVMVGGKAVMAVRTESSAAPAASPAPAQPSYAPAAPTQATTGYAQPQTAYAAPQASAPQTTYNQPQTAYSAPQTAYSAPQAGGAQPQTAYNQPQTAYTQPQTAYNQPQAGSAQPQTAYNPPQAATPQTAYSAPQPAYTAPQPSYTAPASAPAAKPVDLSAPTPPKGPCSTPVSLIAESSRHVDLGNEAEIAQDVQTAADEYRAAITMDACNALAWAALGSLALREGQAADAVTPLRVAHKLKPEHYGVATDLGRAYERLGQSAQAVEAYRDALEARPGHAPAKQGLDRLGASPR